MWERRKSGGSVNWCSLWRNQCGNFSRNPKKDCALSSYPISRTWLKGLYSLLPRCLHIYIYHGCFHNGKDIESAPMSISHEQIMEMYYIDTRRFYCTIKKNEIKISRMWMGQINIILSEINQAQKDKYCIFPPSRAAPAF